MKTIVITSQTFYLDVVIAIQNSAIYIFEGYIMFQILCFCKEVANAHRWYLKIDTRSKYSISLYGLHSFLLPGKFVISC